MAWNGWISHPSHQQERILHFDWQMAWVVLAYGAAILSATSLKYHMEAKAWCSEVKDEAEGTPNIG